jgi:hypothetical protein
MNGERIAGQARNDKLVVIPDLIRDPGGAGKDLQRKRIAEPA